MQDQRSAVAPAISPQDVGTPLRVLHLYSGNLYGGIEVMLKTLAASRALSEMESEFALCFEGRLAKELDDTGVVLHRLGAVRTRDPSTILAARRRLRNLLLQRHFDVVVAHSAWPQAIFGATVRAARKPLVFYLHDAANGKHWVDRWAKLTKPDLVICNSRFTATTAARLYPDVAKKVIAYPVSVLSRHQDGPGRRRLRESLGASPETVVILQASRMQSWKGQRLLIESLALLDPGAPWICWIAGGAQRPSEIAYEQELKDLAAKLKIAERVRFLGQRADVPDLLAAADVFCQPNLGPEPFGIVFIEALSAGLPVVATAMGGAMEIVDERCGQLVSPEPHLLAKALARLVNEERTRQELGNCGPERARALCDPQTQVPLLAAAFAGAADHSPFRPEPRAPEPLTETDVSARAQLSKGSSDGPIHSMVGRVLRSFDRKFDTVVDIGCGSGGITRSISGLFAQYIGCDVVAYDGFPSDPWAARVEVNLDRAPFPLADASADLVLGVEVIEHVENPRAFVRELARIVRPGGRVLITTPNQLSFLSKLTLVTRNQFSAFQERPGLYPSHISALLEEDLLRIARECGLTNIEIHFSGAGRIPFSAKRWPTGLGFGGRTFSDNVLLTAVRPDRQNAGRAQVR